MSKRTQLIPAMLVLALATSPLLATPLSTSRTNLVALNWNGSVAELREFTADIESRLEKRPYNRLNSQQQGWIIEQIALIRAELEDGGDDAVMSDRLQRLASDFETAIVQVEEGQLSCQHEQRTGTRMVTQRCFSQQRLQEDRASSQAQMRKWIRTPLLTGGGGKAR